MHLPVGKGLIHSSGRVIALGRLFLGLLFIVAIGLDASQPAHAPGFTYAILITYIVLAAAIAIATWNNWWLDARLAGPAHAIDILLFTLLVLLTAGYTSPFFAFFMFVLLAAAIRWDWHATALTAILLSLLYLGAGLLVMKSEGSFELQRFAVRTGHLIILSLILIWFGANQRWARLSRGAEELFANPTLDESPLETGLRAAMRLLHASTGIFVSRQPGSGSFTGLVIRPGEVRQIEVSADAIEPALDATPFLYDFARNRALNRDLMRNLVALAPKELVERAAASALGLGNGLAIPVRSDWAEGVLFFQRIPGLSTDHIDIGSQIAGEVATHIQGHALLKAAEESAEARSRLALARDLHDSVVQFVAGAAFRLEALKRSNSSGAEIDSELDELKQLMMQEQRELRSFITSLRSGPMTALKELAEDLQALASRLSRQWDVVCTFACSADEMLIPTRLRLDTNQLMREAVANAVRHASAKSISVELAGYSSGLSLTVINDGAGLPHRDGQFEMPTSLRERVEQAGGDIDMARGMGVTKLSILLPIRKGGQ